MERNILSVVDMVSGKFSYMLSDLIVIKHLAMQSTIIYTKLTSKDLYNDSSKHVSMSNNLNFLQRFYIFHRNN